MARGKENGGFDGSVDGLEIDVGDSQDAQKATPAKEATAKSVTYIQLFRFATPGERVQVALSLLLAVGTGACVPFFNVIYSEFTGLLAERSTALGSSSPCHLINLFGGCQVLTNATLDVRMSALRDDAVAFAIGCVSSGLVQFALASSAVAVVNRAALRQICRIRGLYLRALLRQEQAWHEARGAGNVATSLSDDLEKISEAIGEKLVMFVFLLVSFTSSIVVALVAGWELTLVVLTAAPVIVISQGVVAKVQSSLASRESKSYAVAGACAEEALGAVRTVVAFAGEAVEEKRYADALAPATSLGVRRGFYGGVGGGVMWLAIYCSYSLAFWYGVKLILEGRSQEGGPYTPAVIVIVLFGMLTGTMNLGQASPHLEAFNVARGAAASVFEVLQRRSLVDSLGTEGMQPKNVLGDLEFTGIGFRYPSRPGVQVLTDFSLRVRRGQTVALVGESGSGKSTVLRLAQRFFDPEAGTVSLDGVDVRSLNVGWLRRQSGVVGQEPVLFNGTVADNIRFGAPEVSDDDVWEAAKAAHAHDFIQGLPEGYATLVGERGAQLSGGQKQRVALARALVRRPALLLLDEPTSALDRASERQVQAALDSASKGRTTLLVAHRLSTVRAADAIVVLSGGKVVEQGSHDELMALAGVYSRLVAADGEGDDEDLTDDEGQGAATQDALNGSLRKEWKTPGKVLDIEHEEVEDQSPAPFARVFSLSRPELPYVIVGAVAAVVVGCTLPAFAVLFGGLFSVFSLEDADEVRSRTALFAVYFVALGLLSGAGTFVLTWSMSVAGSRLTARLRVDALRALLRQEAAWFDLPRNAVAALASRLSADAAAVQGATGSRVAVLLQAVATLLVGFSVAASYSWRMALVSSCTVPVILGAVIAEARVVRGDDQRERQALERAAAIAVEATSQVHTVAGLAAEDAVIERYERELRTALREGRGRSRLRGIVFAMSQSVSFMCYSLSFWFGATLVANGSMPYFHVIVVAEALVFGAKMLGQALAFAPNLLTVRRAAARLLALADRKTALPAPPEEVDPKALDGDVTLTEVSFAYPTRLAAKVLRSLDMRVRRGQTVALVGESGSGKSTVLQLIQRLYDVTSGCVTVGNCDVRSVPLAQLRSRVAVVSQEPVLFARSLAENIAYGDNGRRVPLEDVVDAAKQAHAHEFISAMPEGYATLVGERGAQLSGGQKQRVALARALVRRPALLLLDEPTSALDRATEAAVHAALSAARAGRTCVTVAHRAAAAEDADSVLVLRAGAVVEEGTHTQLLQRGGAYAKMHRRGKTRDQSQDEK